MMIARGYWSFEGSNIRLCPWWSAINAIPSPNYVEVQDQASWVEVRGVPFNFWSSSLISDIGNMFGGLIEVHKDTKDWKDLFKVRNFNSNTVYKTCSVEDYSFSIMVSPLADEPGEYRAGKIRIQVPEKVVETIIPNFVTEKSVEAGETGAKEIRMSCHQATQSAEISIRTTLNKDRVNNLPLTTSVSSADISNSNSNSNSVVILKEVNSNSNSVGSGVEIAEKIVLSNSGSGPILEQYNSGGPVGLNNGAGAGILGTIPSRPGPSMEVNSTLPNYANLILFLLTIRVSLAHKSQLTRLNTVSLGKTG